MTIDALKKIIYSVVKEYFSAANVMWSEQQAVKPNKPLIKLKMDNFVPTQHFITESVSPEIRRIQPVTARLEVQIFTHGNKVEIGGDTYCENSAVSDLVEFSHYFISDYVTEKLDRYEIAVRTDSPVDDISAVVDTAYEYRSIQTYQVSFLSESVGKAGVAVFPTSSGGGTQDLYDMSNGWFEQVNNIEEEIE